VSGSHRIVSGITTHVLDLARGRPAAGLAVTLERRADDGGWEPLGQAWTDDDGRVRGWSAAAAPAPGVHRLTFATGAYFAEAGVEAFHPEVSVVFRVADGADHHVPLLLSPFGYTTYRGS
jgi:5-hydroxyisourate hydrolase